MKEKVQGNYGMTTEKLVDIDFEISVTSMSSDVDTIAEVSGHVDYEKESDDEEQPTDCISKPSFKDVMNTITVLEDYSLFSNFGANLMKALKNLNPIFDLGCLFSKKQFTIKDFL